jgi:transposase InsO family protein
VPASGEGSPAQRPPKTSSTGSSAGGGPNELWITDITEHPTREGKVYCVVVLDAFSRRVVGLSISHNPTAALTCNALGMAIEQRDAIRGTVIHSDSETAQRAAPLLA